MADMRYRTSTSILDAIDLLEPLVPPDQRQAPLAQLRAALCFRMKGILSS
jgi:hypothetical protein